MGDIKAPVDPGPSGWNEILEKRSPHPALNENKTADWLVIGGGFAGLSAAERLHQLHPGDNITLLEASQIAHGPAGRNSGFMIDLPHDLSSDDYGGDRQHDQMHITHNRAAIDFAKGVVEQYGISPEAFNPCGKYNGAATNKGQQHNLDFARHLDAMGEDYSLLDDKQMRELTGIDYYQSGLFCPGTVMLQPALFVRQWADALSRHINLFENSPVIKLEPDGQTWQATTPQGKISAPKIILAVNGHLNSFGYYTKKLMHVFTYASMTRALSNHEISRLGGIANWGITPADPMGTTVRKVTGTGGTRIIIRNRFTYDADMTVPDDRVAKIGKDHDRSYTNRFGMLANGDMEYRWGGRLCLSLNNVQAIGEIDHGIYSAACQNGLGTTKGTLSGFCAADLASGEKSSILDDLLAEPSPKPLYPHPFMSLGATATLRWKEYKAGKEF